MCGTIKYENTSRKIGDLVIYRNDNEKTVDGFSRIDEAPWLGHCRQESPTPANATPVKLLVKSYTEKGVEFTVPEGKYIDAYLVKGKNFPKGEGIFIVARPVTDEEKKRCLHPRHPRFK